MVTEAIGLKAQHFHDIDWIHIKELDKDAVRAFILAEVTRGRDTRYRWDSQALAQLSWVRGDQSVVSRAGTAQADVDSELLQDFVIEGLPMELRDPLQINELRQFAATWMGMTLNERMSFVVRPQRDGRESVVAARLQMKLLQYLWHHGRAPGLKATINAAWLMFCTGFSGIKTLWDPFAGDVAEIGAKDLGMKDSTGFGSLIGRVLRGRERNRMTPDGKLRMPLGDIRFEAVSGFDITEPVGTTDLNEAEWIIESRVRSMAEGKRRYGKDWEGVRAGEGIDDRWRELRGVFSYGEGGGEAQDPSGAWRNEVVLVHTLWVPKTPGAIPDGAHAVATESKTLLLEPHPYQHGRIPISFAMESPDPLNARPGAVMRDLMGLQVAKNRLASFRMANVAMRSVPRFLAEERMNLGAEDFSNFPVIKQVPNDTLMDGARGIFPYEVPALGGDVRQLDEDLGQGMRDIAGVHLNSQGQRESKQQSGRHAALMQQADDQAHNMTRMMFRMMHKSVGEQALWLGYQFIDRERRFGIVDDVGAREIVVLANGQALSPGGPPDAPYSFNIDVDMGVRPSFDRTLNNVEALTQMGWLQPGNQDHWYMVMRWLGEGDSDGLGREFAEDRANASAENRLMLIADDFPVPEPGDDHRIHVESHLKFQATDPYREAVLDKPQVARVMELHVRLHYWAAAENAIRPALIAEKVELTLRRRMGLLPSAGSQPGGGPPAPQPAPAAPARPVAALTP